MYYRLVNAARIDVVIQLESRPEREACHSDRKRHKVPIPHLELLMTSRHQLRPGDVAHNKYLQALSLVGLCHMLSCSQGPLRIESVEQVCEAFWQAILTDKEEPDVQAEHAKLQPVDEPLLVIEASRQHLPVNGHLI